MTLNLPSEMDAFIKNLVINGQFPTEQDAVAEALRLLMSREELKREIAIGVKQLREGDTIEEDELFAELEQIVDQAEREQQGH